MNKKKLFSDIKHIHFWFSNILKPGNEFLSMLNVLICIFITYMRIFEIMACKCTNLYGWCAHLPYRIAPHMCAGLHTCTSLIIYTYYGINFGIFQKWMNKKYKRTCKSRFFSKSLEQNQSMITSIYSYGNLRLYIRIYFLSVY